MPTALNLIVIRARNAAQLAEFYEGLGLHFQKHRHGEGAEHFAAEMQGTVFEIYPLQEAHPSTNGVRIGFQVQDITSAFQCLVSRGAKILRKPASSPWGERAVLQDSEGHTIELIKT